MEAILSTPLLAACASAVAAAAPAEEAAPWPVPAGFGHAFADIDGTRIHYVTGGKGPRTVLLHGWPVTSYAWRKVLPLLAERYTLIVPDLPGFADSGPSDTGYEKATIAALLHGLVRHLGEGSVFLAGHDMGGPVAYAYAARYRGDVRRLALIETMLPGFGLEELKAIPAWHMGFAMTAGLPEILVAGRERPFLEYLYRRGTIRPDAITERDLDEYLRAYTLPGRMSAGFDYYRALPRDVPQMRSWAAEKLTIPVLVVGAGHGIRCNADWFRPVAADVRQAWIAECGHHAPDDDPESLAAALRAFFEQDA